MTSLLNDKRPPVFCPGCSHSTVVEALDTCLQMMGLRGEAVAIVTDIGCSGLFDTFFNTHALHGIHGRALTYATGLKLACPELTVITIMGDGGLGIGGAHVLSSCRRNLDITLLVLNNFNYGMTGGQCSPTTPADSLTASGFLNDLEAPLDICRVSEAAGSPWVQRSLATEKDLAETLREAITFNGFSLLDIWGICPGRYSRKNKMSIKELNAKKNSLVPTHGLVSENQRAEYGSQYRHRITKLTISPAPISIEQQFEPHFQGRQQILILGSAGQRINTAAEILCLSALSAGLHATQKNDYPITVLRGHSVCEVVLSHVPVGYTGISQVQITIALSQAGIDRKKNVLSDCNEHAVIICQKGLTLPDNRAQLFSVDFSENSLPKNQWALAALAILAIKTGLLTVDMLKAGLGYRFTGKQFQEAQTILERSLTTTIT